MIKGDGQLWSLGSCDTTATAKSAVALPRSSRRCGARKWCRSQLVLTQSGADGERRGLLVRLGTGRNGQLGHGDTEDQTLPKLIEAMRGKRVVQVSAGG